MAYFKLDFKGSNAAVRMHHFTFVFFGRSFVALQFASEVFIGRPKKKLGPLCFVCNGPCTRHQSSHFLGLELVAKV